MRALQTFVLLLCFAPLLAFAEDAGVRDAGAAAAATGSLTASLSQTLATEGPIEVGETVTLNLRVEHPAGAVVTFPESFRPARWSLIDARRVPLGAGEKGSGSLWQLEFGIYRPGTTELEPFDVRIATPDGRDTVLATEPVEVKVISVLADLEEAPEFKPARPPVPVWVDDYTLAWVGGGFALLALFGFLAWWARRQQALAPEPPPPPRKPHEIALEKLSALAADDLVERGAYMIFWVRLSEAIREYLGRTYGFPPTELTTTEVLDNLLDVKWPAGLDLTDVRRFLRRCDEVKFGGARPDVEESSEFLRRAFSIVELTRPRAEAEEDVGAATRELLDKPDDDETSTEPAGEQHPDRKWMPPGDSKAGDDVSEAEDEHVRATEETLDEEPGTNTITGPTSTLSDETGEEE